MRAVAIAAALLLAAGAHARGGVVVIGSKAFTEQEVLAAIAAELIERTTELRVQRRFGLGGTDLCHAALRSGQIDLYIEYTGTALVNVLGRDPEVAPASAWLQVSRAYRERFDLVWLPPIGFNNTYAIAVRREAAEREGWATLSNLADDSAELGAGVPAEFMERSDGMPGLMRRYGMRFGSVREIDPGLMYEAVASGQVDVISGFATDPRLDAYGLAVLEDDRRFFPPYDAAVVVRADTLARHPSLHDALSLLAGAIDDGQMRALNAQVDLERRSPREVARAWVAARLGDAAVAPDTAPAPAPSFLGLALERRGELGRKALRHLGLTAAGVGLAIAIGLPLGVLIHRVTPARAPVLAGAEIVQTIPSLAMLAFLFAVYGLLGVLPAVTALVLYALLPIVLNTFTGLRGVPAGVVEAARGVGMTPMQRLRMVEIPLALPVLIAGIRAAAVLTVGIATLSTYIGAGGLGDYIARGLARNDPRLTLLGAVPAALMAVALSLTIRGLERAVGPSRG